MTEIDLKPFCGTDETRPYLCVPFSHGDFSYATNGHIMVRIPRSGDLPEQTKNIATNWDAPFEGFEAATFSPVKVNLPPPIADVECESCEGRGQEHDCPDCECICPECEGSGLESADHGISTTIRGHTYALRYVRLMLSLPGVILADNTDAKKPLLFRFDGGIGALMPRNVPAAKQVDVEAA